jgi:ectoine hydroxylase-related dioxygenase (phytanoyl-CoA dioxygenase family)
MRTVALANFDRAGFGVVPAVLSLDEICALTAAIESAGCGAAVRRRAGIYAIRNLSAEVPAVAALACDARVRALARSVLGEGCQPVRTLLFDKTPGANWQVPWHQDRAIAVAERREVSGFGPWSVKAGVPHVNAPAEVLDRMVTVRVHLDPCGVDQGPLRVRPGTHRSGVWSDAQIAERCRGTEAFTCLVAAGDVLVMRPLLVHASGKARRPGHRRVIQIEFAAGDLPAGLHWHQPLA